MNVVMTKAASQDYLIRSEVVKRRNAEIAYDKTLKYNGDNQKTLSKLEELITNKSETISSQKGFEKLDAGLVKQVTLPIGKTLEESIDLWRGVRSEAIAVPEPTTNDNQLAAIASSKIRQAEAQIGLNELAVKATSMELPLVSDEKPHDLQQRYERAITSYSFQVQARENGFKYNWPSFFRVA